MYFASFYKLFLILLLTLFSQSKRVSDSVFNHSLYIVLKSPSTIYLCDRVCVRVWDRVCVRVCQRNPSFESLGIHPHHEHLFFLPVPFEALTQTSFHHSDFPGWAISIQLISGNLFGFICLRLRGCCSFTSLGCWSNNNIPLFISYDMLQETLRLFCLPGVWSRNRPPNRICRLNGQWKKLINWFCHHLSRTVLISIIHYSIFEELIPNDQLVPIC